jgi:RecB family exonuclease
LEIPDIRELFEQGGPHVELLREQPVDAILHGKWLSGTIDRLHLHRDGSGAVNRVEIIDFKTDSVSDLAELAERHAPQMRAYQEAMAVAYPRAEIICRLVSTRLGQVITL